MKVYIVKDVGYEWCIDIGVFLTKEEAEKCKNTLEENGVVKTKLGKMMKFLNSDNIRIDCLEVG